MHEEWLRLVYNLVYLIVYILQIIKRNIKAIFLYQSFTSNKCKPFKTFVSNVFHFFNSFVNGSSSIIFSCTQVEGKRVKGFSEISLLSITLLFFLLASQSVLPFLCSHFCLYSLLHFYTTSAKASFLH